MYYVCKELEIAVAHKLNLSYDSPCQNLHGHNLKIKVFCRSKKLNADGMVIDFKHIKQEIHGKLDHGYLNDMFDFNPTAENLARWIVDIIPECYRAEVEESNNNWAAYEVGDVIC